MKMVTVNRGLCFLVLCLTVGCSPIPRKYLQNVDPSVTLTALRASSNVYQGKLVILGGVILEEESRDGWLWLHAKNRPLDQDYRPQLPPSVNDPEGGMYWVAIPQKANLPGSHHHWADMTVVGRLAGWAPGEEPILRMVYIRGWGRESRHDAVWEDRIDANYLPSMPAGIVGELGQ